MTEDEHSLGRLTALTDGVFAIALTVLVLRIPVPRIADRTASGELRTALSGLEGQFISYAATFAIIAAFWQQHRRLFRLTGRHDEWVGRLNAVFLLLVAFLPFPSALVGRYGANATAIVFFDLSVMAVALAFVLLWQRLHRFGHFGDRLPAAYGRWILLRTVGVFVLLAVSAAVAPFSTDAASYVWLGIIPMLFAVGLRFRPAIRRADSAQDDPGE
ncbi:TMEM175 family protein [Streptomyces sp. NBC_01190]|uniref:TMEM175 family protein n=1 Tax=Streptomyces sp. NBC_01190 TaxID=2903767 RepID=UPI003863BFCE|nr:TMEM175 family protein [Streptomyces sp. NBC_01190]